MLRSDNRRKAVISLKDVDITDTYHEKIDWSRDTVSFTTLLEIWLTQIVYD